MGAFAKSLREALFVQHFGWDCERLSAALDLANPTAHIEIMKVADKNTSIFEEGFHCLPSDFIKTWPELESYRSTEGGPKGVSDASMIPVGTQTSNILDRLSQIRGNVVRYPVGFLEHEDRLDGGGRFLDRFAPS